jgi:hypothetical protein
MKSLAFWLGLTLFSIYLLSFSGKLHIMDEFVGYAVGNNLVQHGRADVNQFVWTNHWHSTPPGIWGIDNNLYTKKAPGISLAATPFIWLGHRALNLNAIHLSLLLSGIVTALTGSLLLFWLVDLGLSRSVAALAAMIYGLATIAWVYARFLWEHSVMALLFLLMLWALHRAIYRPGVNHRLGWIWLTGIAAAASLTMRFEALVAVGFIGVFLFCFVEPLPSWRSGLDLLRITKNKQRWLWAVVYAVFPILTMIWLFYFNFVRFGSVSETGYNREILFQRPWEGTFGLLFSPSTGLFIYVPVMLLFVWGVRPAWRRLPHPYFWLILSLVIFYWIFYGSWFSWGSTWVWGPRFMLHTLPLLMLFIAEVLEYLRWPPAGSLLRQNLWRWLARIAVTLLVLAGIFINFLGVAVDLNEHFLRLGRNDNYVFNWEAFAPAGHWQILREGLWDLAWLQPEPENLVFQWTILWPPLLLLVVSLVGLGLVVLPDRIKWATLARKPLTIALVALFAVFAVYVMMRATTNLSLSKQQARADMPLLETVGSQARGTDALLIPMPPFGDVLEISSFVMAYLHQPLPTYAWIESEPRAIQPDERDRIWQAVTGQSERAWVFERWLTPDDSLWPTARQFYSDAFPVEEHWFESSGRLTLYALPDELPPGVTASPDITFAGGLVLRAFSVAETMLSPGDIVRLRVTWEAPAEGASGKNVVTFAHLLAESGNQNVAQHDRLLVDVTHPERSPLLPGQTVRQGYGLQLPDDLPAGSYPLVVGLYSAATGERLPRADGSPDDFLYLTDITVQ